MKMRKLFALLVASALLAALAIIPASAGFVATYTQEYGEWESVPANGSGDGGYYSEGTVAANAGAIDVSAAAGASSRFGLFYQATAYKAVFALTEGEMEIVLGNNYAGATLHLRISADGVYKVLDNTTFVVDNAQRSFTIDPETHLVTAEIMFDKTTLYVNVNGVDYSVAVSAFTKGFATNVAGDLINAMHLITYKATEGDVADAFSVKSFSVGTSVNTTVQEGDKDVTVTVNPTNQDATPATKDVTIAFGDFAFTYTVTNKVNPGNGEVLESEGSWSADTDTVQITNNTVANYEGEDVTVWATASYAPVANAVPGVSFDLDNTSANELGSGENVTITGTISGTPTNVKEAANAVVLGTITVVVESVNPAA